MKKTTTIIFLILLCLILFSCENNDDDNSLTQNIEPIAPEVLTDVKLEFQNEDSGSEDNLTLKSDGSAVLVPSSDGWIWSKYLGSYTYERQYFDTGAIYVSYTHLETFVIDTSVSDPTRYSEEYTLYFFDGVSGNYSKISGESVIDGTFTIVDIE